MIQEEKNLPVTFKSETLPYYTPLQRNCKSLA